MLEGGDEQGLPARRVLFLFQQVGCNPPHAFCIAGDVERERRARRDGEEGNGNRLARVVGRLTFLIVVLLVWSHDIDGQITCDLRDHVPEGQQTTEVLLATICAFQAEEQVEIGQFDGCFAGFHYVAFFCAPAMRVAPVAFGQLARGLTHHALDAAAGQIGQPVGPEEGEAVFQRVLVAEAGGEGGGGSGIAGKQPRIITRCQGNGGLAFDQRPCAILVILTQPRHLAPGLVGGVIVLFPKLGEASSRAHCMIQGCLHALLLQDSPEFLPRATPSAGHLANLAFLVGPLRPDGQIHAKAHAGRGAAEVFSEIFGYGGDAHVDTSCVTM